MPHIWLHLFTLTDYRSSSPTYYQTHWSPAAVSIAFAKNINYIWDIYLTWYLTVETMEILLICSLSLFSVRILILAFSSTSLDVHWGFSSCPFNVSHQQVLTLSCFFSLSMYLLLVSAAIYMLMCPTSNKARFILRAINSLDHLLSI